MQFGGTPGFGLPFVFGVGCACGLVAEDTPGSSPKMATAASRLRLKSLLIVFLSLSWRRMSAPYVYSFENAQERSSQNCRIPSPAADWQPAVRANVRKQAGHPHRKELAKELVLRL